jgi:hypothetical protein
MQVSQGGVLMRTIPMQFNITCHLCNQYLDPGTAVLDESSRAVHEDCYIQLINEPETCSQEWVTAA